MVLFDGSGIIQQNTVSNILKGIFVRARSGFCDSRSTIQLTAPHDLPDQNLTDLKRDDVSSRPVRSARWSGQPLTAEGSIAFMRPD